MTPAFIVDSSLALTWLFKDETTTASKKLLTQLDTESALVPSLWLLEIANVLSLAELKGRITAAESSDFIDQISRLDIQVEPLLSEQVFTHLLPLCRSHGLTSYDAVYLDLAMRRQLPLATLDEQLRKAAKKAGVKLLGK
jgi:predicted nucleic acid-binding protein